MRTSWERRIARARDLASDTDAATPLLEFYAQVLAIQRDLYDALDRADGGPSGSLERDLHLLRGETTTQFLRLVADSGPEALASDARVLAASNAIDDALLEYWRRPSDRQFFAKALLQPYVEWLVDHGVTPAERRAPRGRVACGRCGGAPQLSILDLPRESLDGATRQLLCATCLTPWPYRRVVCPYCGDEDERHLAYFQSPAFEHVRVEACDGCQRYLKGIDLTRLGLAVPLVDELAAAALDLWAVERGYHKIELNLMGL